jgi:hypothetical protein
MAEKARGMGIERLFRNEAGVGGDGIVAKDEGPTENIYWGRAYVAGSHLINARSGVETKSEF